MIDFLHRTRVAEDPVVVWKLWLNPGFEGGSGAVEVEIRTEPIRYAMSLTSRNY